MGTVLEITQLTNGDIVLRDADEDGEALVRICFSGEVRDMLGDDLVGVAEAMIEAATDFLEGESFAVQSHLEENRDDEDGDDASEQSPVIH